MGRIGIIGGSGLYNVEGIEWETVEEVETPFGKPSDAVKLGNVDGKPVVFLPRHGNRHQYPPHMVNYRANLWALKHIGVDRVLAFSAVGSLKEEYARGHVCVVRQYLDFTKSRKRTFYDNEAVHVSMAEPYCPKLSQLAVEVAHDLGIPVHDDVTYVCIEGPSFSTKAESSTYRRLGGGVIGMTGCPETQLARELGLCYASITTVTDYDCWKDEPVSAEEVAQTMKANENNIKRIMIEMIKRLPEEWSCSCKDALRGARL